MSDTKRAPLRAPRGPVLSCRNWLSEAALRMLMNNLDPEVAERPDELVVYGGIGKAARNWQCFDQIVAALRGLREDESAADPIRQTGGRFPHSTRMHPECVDRELQPRGEMGHLGAFQRARYRKGLMMFGQDDRRLLDLYR